MKIRNYRQKGFIILAADIVHNDSTLINTKNVTESLFKEKT